MLAALRTSIRARPDRALFWALLAAQLLVLARTPVLTGHDLPQHLAYARLLADWQHHGLAPIYEPPFGDDPYFATYRVLIALGRWMPLSGALTVLVGAYAIATAFSFAALARSASGRSFGEVCMPAALGPLLVWSPITCMGFLPFMLGVPLVMAGAAAALRFHHDRRARWLVAVALPFALLASLHVALLAMALLALGCLWADRRAARDLLPLGVALTSATVVLAVFARHRVPAPPFDWERLGFNVKTFGVVDGTVGTFVISWSCAAERVKLAAAAALGPFPWAIKGVVALAVLAFAVVVRLSPRSPGRSRPRRTLVIASALFLLATIAAPAAIQQPDDMCLIDFRMYTLAFMFSLACLPDEWIVATRSRIALAALATLVVGVWGWSQLGAGEEARPVLDLVERLGPTDRVLALSFHDRSAYLDEDNAVLHYLPVHHTARSGGSTTLFWGKFSRHLPIGWAKGQEPPHPATWSPEDFNDAQLDAATHVLASLPRADDEPVKIRGAERLASLVGTRLRTIACEGDFCLYSVTPRE